MNILKNVIGFIWGFPQNLLGLIGYIVCRMFNWDFKVYKNCPVIITHSNVGSISLGIFLFISEDESFLVNHEYGHTLQSLILGPLYLLVIGIPSLIWAGCFEKYRQKYNKSYYDFYTEKWANKLVGLQH